MLAASRITTRWPTADGLGAVPPRPARAATSVGAVDGDDPLADQSPDRLAGLAAELADPHPAPGDNSYPFAYEQVAQLFDHPAAPDLCVCTPRAHNWEDQGGHLGEHGLARRGPGPGARS